MQEKIRNAKNFEITDATERQWPDQMLNEGYILGKLTNRLGNVVWWGLASHSALARFIVPVTELKVGLKYGINNKKYDKYWQKQYIAGNYWVRIAQNHLEALYLRAFLVPFWSCENILKTRISILGHFLSFFNTKKCKTLWKNL